MKFETVRIYLIKWRFWFVVWSKNFATVATWPYKKKQQQKFLPMVDRCARENFAKNVCGEPRRQKRQNRPLSRGSHFVSGDLKSFVYAQLAL